LNVGTVLLDGVTYIIECRITYNVAALMEMWIDSRPNFFEIHTMQITLQRGLVWHWVTLSLAKTKV